MEEFKFVINGYAVAERDLEDVPLFVTVQVTEEDGKVSAEVTSAEWDPKYKSYWSKFSKEFLDQGRTEAESLIEELFADPRNVWRAVLEEAHPNKALEY